MERIVTLDLEPASASPPDDCLVLDELTVWCLSFITCKMRAVWQRVSAH